MWERACSQDDGTFTIEVIERLPPKAKLHARRQ
jgi:hypothetical protein